MSGDGSGGLRTRGLGAHDDRGGRYVVWPYQGRCVCGGRKGHNDRDQGRLSGRGSGDGLSQQEAAAVSGNGSHRFQGHGVGEKGEGGGEGEEGEEEENRRGG